MWARLTGPIFAEQAAAALSLVEAPYNHGKAAAVAKEAMAIIPGNRTSLSIRKFLEAPFAGKHLKWIETAQSIIITGSRQQAGRQEGWGV